MDNLRHPFIVRLRHRFQDKNNIYFLTELAERGELAHLLKQTEGNKLPMNAVRFVVAELVSILEYLHDSGIAHRDLKPANIFVSQAGHLKLGKLRILIP